jgi:hypothetical protein
LRFAPLGKAFCHQGGAVKPASEMKEPRHRFGARVFYWEWHAMTDIQETLTFDIFDERWKSSRARRGQADIREMTCASLRHPPLLL